MTGGIYNTFPLSLYGGYDSTMDGDCGLSSIGMSSPGSIFPMSFGGGYMPGMYGGDISSYTNNATQLMNFYGKDVIANQLRNKTDLSRMYESEQLRKDGYDDTIAFGANKLQSLAGKNEQAKFQEVYADYLKAIREKYGAYGGEIDENILKAQAQKEYTKVTGTRMTDDLEAGGDSSFATGLKKGFFGLGFFLDKRSVQSNIAMITERGVKVGDDASGESKSIIDNLYPDGSLTNKEKFQETAGEVLGFAGTIAAIPLALVLAKFGLKGIGKSFLLGGKTLGSKGVKV
jgi:hypothetical protein